MFKDKYFCYVNSHNRLNGTNYNFTYNVQIPGNLIGKINRVVVLDALIPKSYYLVQTNANTFTLTEGATSVSISFPVGCYILSAFASTLQTLLNSNSPNTWSYTVTSPLANVTTASNTGKWIISVSGNTSQPSITVSSVFYEPFGFAQSSTNTFSSNSLTSTNVVKLQSEDRVLLCSDVCVASGSTDIGILQAIDGQSSPDFTSINYQCSQVEANAKYFMSKGTTFKFVVTNEDGQELQLNGLNISFTLLFYRENPVFDNINVIIDMLIKSLADIK